MSEYLLGQKIKMLGLSEKVGFIGSEQIECQLQFATPVGHDELKIIVITFQPVVTYPLCQPTGDQRFFSWGHINPRRLMQPALETGEFVIMQLDLVQVAIPPPEIFRREAMPLFSCLEPDEIGIIEWTRLTG